MREIFGIGITDRAERKNFKDEFELVRDLDEEVYYESKKTYHHEEEGLTFDYKYVVEVLCYDDEECEGELKMGVALYLTPMFNSLCDEVKKDMVRMWGIDSLDDPTLKTNEVTAAEVAEEGYGVMFGSEAYDAPNGWDDLDEEMLDDIATVYGTLDAIRGFYIDRPWNRIGTTGWDTLKHDINGEKLFKF